MFKLLKAGATAAGGLLAACLLCPLAPVHAQGDVFSSRGSPSPYGGGNTTGRTGKQAQQDDSVYCQQTPDGRVIPQPYGGTRRNIPCGPAFAPHRAPEPPPQPPLARRCACPAQAPSADSLARQRTTAANDSAGAKNCDCALPPVFNYYYINGINTPHEDPQWRPAWRGNYQWDYNLIKSNLLDLGAKGARVPAGEKALPGSYPPIRVANERDVMRDETYNRSGTQRGAFCEDLARKRLPGGPLEYQFYQLLCTGDAFRAGSFTGSLAPGDLLESFLQSSSNNTAAQAATQPDVAAFAKLLLKRFEAERAKSSAGAAKNYFVLIVHSQGNFFGEGLAYRLAFLEGQLGRSLYAERLGIMAFASPTDYRSLPGNFPDLRLRHFTRKDDAIIALASSPILYGKRPFAANLPALWPWKAKDLAHGQTLFELRPSPPFIGSPLIDMMNLGPPKDLCRPANDTVCDAGLYSPLMNSHLLENYLIDPPLTRVGKPINPKAGYLMDRDNGLAPPVGPERYTLARARRDLACLKRALLLQQKPDC